MVLSQYALAVAFGFVNLVWATPVVPVMADAKGISWEPAGRTQSTCDPSTFAESQNTDAADWRECASLYSSWTSKNGTFKLGDVNTAEFTPILHTTNCTLGVKPADPHLGPFTIGDRDIKTLLETSLKEFSKGTDLSVAGIVKCAAATGSKGDVTWQISKSDGGKRSSSPCEHTSRA